MAQGRIGDAELRCSSGKACMFGDSDKRSQFGELGCAHVFLRTSDVSKRGVNSGCPIRERRHRLGVERATGTSKARLPRWIGVPASVGRRCIGNSLKVPNMIDV